MQRVVLILILLEMRLLRPIKKNLLEKEATCLNPYSTGNEVVADCYSLVPEDRKRS